MSLLNRLSAVLTFPGPFCLEAGFAWDILTGNPLKTVLQLVRVWPKV